MERNSKLDMRYRRPDSDSRRAMSSGMRRRARIEARRARESSVHYGAGHVAEINAYLAENPSADVSEAISFLQGALS